MSGDIIDAGIITMTFKDYCNVLIGKARREKQIKILNIEAKCNTSVIPAQGL